MKTLIEKLAPVGTPKAEWIDQNREYSVELTTAKGTISIQLFPKEAPVTVANFVNLISNKFYDDLTFHRVIPDFVAQGGCPQGTGTGNPGYRFQDECHPSRRHARGMLSMANAGPGTNGSQFFILYKAQPHLDGKHTVFGEVVSGMEFVDGLRNGDKIVSAKAYLS